MNRQLRRLLAFTLVFIMVFSTATVSFAEPMTGRDLSQSSAVQIVEQTADTTSGGAVEVEQPAARVEGAVSSPVKGLTAEEYAAIKALAESEAADLTEQQLIDELSGMDEAQLAEVKAYAANPEQFEEVQARSEDKGVLTSVPRTDNSYHYNDSGFYWGTWSSGGIICQHVLPGWVACQ